MGKYRKKPVVIEAFQWTGEMIDKDDPQWVIDALFKRDISFVNKDSDNTKIAIKTMEGTMVAPKGCFIIKGIEGEIYPCDKEIFYKTYEKVAE